MTEVELQIRRLGSCTELLDHFERPLRASLDRGEQSGVPQAVMLYRAFSFGRTTLEAMIATCKTGDAHGVCVPTLCRAFYEVSHRLLWASREHNGWQRLQTGGADEQRKWADAAAQIPSLAAHAERVRTSMQMILARTDERGKPFAKPPSMEQQLSQIEKADTRCGIVTPPSDFAKLQYTILWRLMSNTAHAHLVQIARDPKGHLQIGVWAAVCATFALLRAVAVVVAPDLEGVRQNVDVIGERIVKILKGDLDLKLDEMTFTFTDGDPVE